MLDYRLDDETEALRKTVREFAMEVVAPRIGEFYERDEFPTDIVRRMGELGLFGLPFPEEYGGAGGDYFHLCVALEELARVDSSVAITLEAGVSLGAMPIYRFGTEEQKQEWLPRLCAGEALGAFGLTEPAAARTPARRRRRRRLEDGQWVINGSKAFITNAGTDLTQLVTVTAGHRHQAGREEGDLGDHRAVGDARLHRRPALLEGRAGTPRTPASCPSATAGCPRRTWWGARAAATRSSCRSSTRGGSRSPRSPSGSRRAASTSR
jgi:hypothetical protein